MQAIATMAPGTRYSVRGDHGGPVTFVMEMREDGPANGVVLGVIFKRSKLTAGRDGFSHQFTPWTEGKKAGYELELYRSNAKAKKALGV